MRSPYPIRSERLHLRPFRMDDFAAVHAYASDPASVRHLVWGPNSCADTERFLKRAIAAAERAMPAVLDLAVTLAADGTLIGGVGVQFAATAEIGWILNRAYRGCGYATEAAAALLDFVFQDERVERVVAHADARNLASLGVMDRLGFRHGSYVAGGRPIRRAEDAVPGDEIERVMEREDWVVGRLIERTLRLPVHFEQFYAFTPQPVGDAVLVCVETRAAIPERRRVPAYNFEIRRQGEPIGRVSLRIGFTEELFYGGQIGYDVDAAWRGRGYAGRAVAALRPLLRQHGMERVLVTNDVNNHASRRVCEKLGMTPLARVRVPEWTELYADGSRWINVFAWDIGAAGSSDPDETR